MKKSNSGLIPLVLAFAIFFGIAVIAILIQEKYFPRDSALRFFVLDCPFENTASPEWQSAERAYEDKRGRDAQERVDNGTANDRDRDAAHERELGSWS